ncbi:MULTISPECIES: hypothetical protein [unclassified Spirosoma]|uniref:hypothetical protein n=1 Tax=unclassified Spirosoma TaxID=2621999 RepID=UPI00095BA094|nr:MULTISPECIES: hypothetical protein [unclassified Spirosoma]MBN8826406.1 hypothetical protein [Spirosoma sp.]OJW75796.1 MAG: hypothetical protein BGO59_04755 [Spirosoma sp. 48-14]
MMFSLKTVWVIALVMLSQLTIAQQYAKPDTTKSPEINELKYNLNASGSRFFKVTFLNQSWLRFNQSNPGTTVVSEPKDNTFDIGLRRTRIQLFGQVSDHVFLYLQFGLNNFNYLNGGFNPTATSNRKIQPFFHDAVGEYIVWKNKDYLKIGYGLTIVNGLSRFSAPGVSNIMSMDVPVFAQATVDQTDEFSRKLSLYARGQIGHLDYRIAMSDPFPIQTNGSALPIYGPNAIFALKGHTKQYQGLFMWQFFDKESHQTPGYNTGTYLGSKKIFNLEAGFITQKNATVSVPAAGDTAYHTMNLWSIASFLDMPLDREKGTAVNAYLGYFRTDYGPNYLRFNGIMNPGSGIVAGYPANTQGNAFPMFGTGSLVYGQVGYLLKRDLFGPGNGTLMPYVQAQIANYERLTKTLGVYNIGINYLIKGHNGKFTLDYQNRPFYQISGNQYAPGGRRGQLTLQYQIFI